MLLAAVMLHASVFAASAVLPQGSKVEFAGSAGAPVTEPLQEKDGLLIAQARTKVTVPLPAEFESLTVIGRAGKDKAGLAADVIWDDQTKTQLFARAGGDGPAADGFLQITGNVKLFVRPNVNFYGNQDRKNRIVRGWMDFPAASEHLVRMEIRRGPQGAQVWFDGRFIQDLLKAQGRFAKLELILSPGAALKEISWSKEKPGKYLPLALEHFARTASWPKIMGDMGWPNVMREAKLPLAAGSVTVEGIPFHATAAETNIDVAGMGFLACPVDDLVSFYWRRSTLDALPEACIVSVPQDTYAFAHILCAAEENPPKAVATDPDRIPEFNLRLTRHANGRGDALADSPVRIPKTGEKTPDAKQVGTISYGPPNAPKTVPIWLIRVPLKSGMIQDILREDERKYCFGYPLPTSRYLDIEIMEPLTGVDETDAFPPDLHAIRNRTFGPPARRTSVHVFGVTLESSPAELIVRPGTPVNAFYAAEKPELRAEILPKEAGSYELAWEFADVDGTIAASGRKSVDCTAGKNEVVSIPVTVGNGWYASRVRLRDAAGRDLVDHRGTFAMLPPDTRKAGAESPHGTWWFNWAHGGNKDIEHVGAMMQRAGLRHTMLSKDLPETATAPHQVTTWCVPWKQPGAANIETWVSGLETHIRETLKNCPSATTVMLYHESDSYGGRFPSELWGVTPPPLDAKNEAAWQTRMQHMIPGLKMIREKFPNMKIQIGNCGNGCAMVAEMFRHGLTKDLVDYVAVEDLGQTFTPEKPALDSLQSAWYLRQTARQFGADNVQITGCYEWIGRMHLKLGLRIQAEWYIRDALHARAYGFHTIALGAIHDAGQGYFHTIWGNGGMCFRYPYLYPKPVYVAMATHTLLLDSAKFSRLVPTSSMSLYAMEFQKQDQWVYALWVPRGRREAKLAFNGDAEVTITDLYGREKSAKGRELDLTASTAVQYVTSKTRLDRVNAGRPSFPDDVPPANFALVDRMDSTSTWVHDGMKNLKRMTGEFPFRTPGNFEFREVDDAEKGKCLEFELKPEGTLWPMIYEHTYIKVKDPKPQPGPYQYVGVWVKGNSSWGEIIAEVAGSDGKPRLILPDWPGSTQLSFDGWNFIRMKLPTGPQWNGAITLTGFMITIPRQVLYATEFVPVPELKIRMKDACLF